jgi:hypothetical protein
MNKNLIMAVTSGFGVEDLAPFVCSLKQTDFRGDVVIFAANTSRDTIAWLRSHGVLVQRFLYPFTSCTKLRNPLYRVWPLCRAALAGTRNPDAVQWFAQWFQNLSILRFFFYRRFLRNDASYRNVMLTDLRDVVFQGDPFREVSGGEIRVFLEEPLPRQGDEINSRRWLTELFGKETVKKLADTNLICSGTVIGDAQRMQEYLDAFMLALSNARSVMRMGMDQGLHNYLLYSGFLNGVTMCPNRESEVLTMGLINPEEKLPRDAAGRLVDSVGRPYPVLHQFDRHPDLNTQIRQRYGMVHECAAERGNAMSQVVS